MAGRNIGDLEFTVNADTGKLSAQLVKGGQKAGTYGGKALVKSFNKEIDQMGGRKLVSTLAEIRGKIEASLANIEAEVGLDDKEARVKAKALEKNLSGLEVYLKAELEDSDVYRQVRFLRQQLKSALDVDADIEIDFEQLKALAEVAQEIIDNVTMEIVPELNKVEARAAFWELKAMAVKENVRIRLEYDEQTYKDQQAKIIAQNKALGDKAGKSFGDGFSRGSMSRLTKIALAIGVVAESAVVGLDALVSQAVAAIASAAAAAGAGIAAVAAQAAGFANVLAATITAFAGVGDAIGGVNDAFAESVKNGTDFQDSYDELVESVADLSPAAADAVLAFAEVRGELAASQSLIQEQFFQGMGDEIIKLADDVLPSLTRSLQVGAVSANAFAKDLVAIAANTDFESLMKGLKPAIDGAFKAAGSLVKSLGPFLEAAAPAAELLADAIAGAAEYLEDFLSADTDEISDFLVRGVESLIKWGDMLTSLGHLLGTVFAVGIDSGDTMVTKLDAIIQKFDAWLQTAEGNSALVEWFDRGEAAMVAFKPVLEGLVEALDRLLQADSAQNFEELAEAIGSALPSLAELLAILGEAGLLTTLVRLLGAMQPVFALISALPDPVLQFAGAMAVVVPLMLKLKALMIAMGVVGPGLVATIKNIGSALYLMAASNPGLLALTVTVSALVVATSIFSKNNKEAEKRTLDLAEAVKAETAALVELDGVMNGAVIASQSISAGLTSGSKEADKFAVTLGNLGMRTNDAFDAVSNLQGALDKDARVDYLAGIAKSAGSAQFGLELTGEEARRLAEIVDGTDDNFESMDITLDDFADSTGHSTAELHALAMNLEHMQDVADNNDLKPMIEAFFEMQRYSSDLNQSVRDTIPTIAELNGMDVTAAQEALAEFSGMLDQTDADATAAAAAADALSNELDLVAEAAERKAVPAMQAWLDGVVESGQQAALAGVEAERLAKMIRAVAESQAKGKGVANAKKFIELGDAFGEAADNANDLQSAIDILFGSQMSLDEATDGMIVSVSQLGTAIKESEGYTDGWSGSIDGLNDDSLALREGLREGISSIQTYAVAATEAGVSTEEITANTEMFRGQLIATAKELGVSEDQAAAYVDKLLGTPDELNTIIGQENMVEALLNADNLELLYDSFGNPILTPFMDDGLEETLKESKELKDVNDGINKSVTRPSFRPDSLSDVKVDVDDLQVDVDTLDQTTVDPEIPMTDWPAATGRLVETQELADTLSSTKVEIDIDIPDDEAVTGRLTTMTTDATNLGEVDPKINISTPGADESIQKVDTLKQKIDGLYSKTVTITTNSVTTGTPGSMTGRLVTGPMNTDVGERGLHEAIIPLQLPLNRVNPEVRGMAAILRGETSTQQPASVGPSRVITNNFTINETDRAETTAQRVVNRVAASLT